MSIATLTHVEPRVATHLDSVRFSDIVQIRNKVMALQAAGKPVYGFHGGEPDFETPQIIKDAMTAALAANQTRYAPSSGIEPLRVAIAEKLSSENGMNVTADDILVTVGGIQALQAAFAAALDPDDEILLFSPFWTPIVDMVVMTGAKAVLVSVDEAKRRGFVNVLETHLSARTRAIYYNTPANPSGEVLGRDEARAVASFAIEHNLVVIADEAYEHIVYDEPHVSIATLPGMAERTISCYTLSKSYAMTGWRVGYVTGPPAFMPAMRKVVLYGTNGVPTPMQWAALAGMKLGHEFLAEKRQQYRERRDVLVSGLNELGLSTRIPGGTFYAFPSCELFAEDSRRAALELLERASIATVPGAVFGSHGEGHLRFGFAVPMERIERGLEALRGFLRD